MLSVSCLVFVSAVINPLGESVMRRVGLICCLLLFFVGACSDKRVRHLASDASMITPGKTSREDVILYLGEPDSQRSVGPGVDEYVYYEDQRDVLRRTPVIRSVVDAQGFEMVVVTITGDIVTECDFRAFDDADVERSEDLTKDEVK